MVKMVKEENECKIIFDIFLVHKNIGKERKKKKESKEERKKERTKERKKERKKKVHKIILCIHTVFVYHGLGIILPFTVYRLYRFYR